MDDTANSDKFYDALPLRTSFGDLSDPANYTALPDGWMIGASDIVGSTRAVAAGKYKTVNMIGAAVISAQINAAAGRAFPFVFG
ncbi:MAG: adenylate cyclase, partial [Rhodobacteraceae bacterium]